jgi:hypothetical protein
MFSDGWSMRAKDDQSRQKPGWSSLARTCPAERTVALGAAAFGARRQHQQLLAVDAPPPATPLLPFGLRLGLGRAPRLPIR